MATAKTTASKKPAAKKQRASPRVAVATSRQLQVFELYEEGGKSFRDIGAMLGISHVAAAKLFNKALAAHRAEIADRAGAAFERIEARAELIAQVNERRAIDDTDERSIEAGKLVLAAGEQQAKLHGLYVAKTELTGKDGGALKTENTNVNAAVDLSGLSTDDLAVLTRILGGTAREPDGE